MLACYRDDGFWILLWYRCSRLLIGGPLTSLPGWGFVGRESTSFRATDQRRARLASTRMRRIHSTDGARLWRLTCVWVTSPRPSLARASGTGSGHVGS